MAVFHSDNPYSNWMSNLPNKLIEMPLNYLAIPGSHDSFTFNISSKSDVAPDAEKAIKILTDIFGRVAKYIIARWAKAQGLNTFDQLQAGIRYLDIRVARNTKAKNEIYSCHGLFGSVVKDQLTLINDFLNLHPKEVVFLDFNHFYDFGSNEHFRLIRYLENIFTNKLVPFKSKIPSLQELWASNHRVFVFYHSRAIQRPYLWPGYSIPSPWPNTNKLDVLEKFWNESYRRGHDTDNLYIMQAVLTPRTSDIVKHPWSTLKSQMADKASPAFSGWLDNNKVAGRGKINCSIIDFANEYGYIEAVMQVNLRTASQIEAMEI